MKWKRKSENTQKTIDELTMLSIENNLVRNVWQILQQGSKFFSPSFVNIWDNGEHILDFAPTLSTQIEKRERKRECLLNEGVRYCATPFPPREGPYENNPTSWMP